MRPVPPRCRVLTRPDPGEHSPQAAARPIAASSSPRPAGSRSRAPPMPAPDDLGDRQANARVLILGAEKRLGRTPLDLRAHPASRVANRENHPVPRSVCVVNSIVPPPAGSASRAFSANRMSIARSWSGSPGILAISPGFNRHSIWPSPCLSLCQNNLRNHLIQVDHPRFATRLSKSSATAARAQSISFRAT